MYKKIIFLVLISVFVSSCGKSAPPPTPTQIPPTVTASPAPSAAPTTELILPTAASACVSPEPTQDDIDRVLNYTRDIFSSTDWEYSYTVDDTRVAFIWQNVSLGAVVYLEALIFPCGYEEPDLNHYFSDQNWQTIFSNYESYQPVTECRSETGIRLYQFETQNQGIRYAIRYWVQNDTDHRVITTMIVMPFESQSLLDTYGAQLFPALPNCS